MAFDRLHPTRFAPETSVVTLKPIARHTDPVPPSPLQSDDRPAAQATPTTQPEPTAPLVYSSPRKALASVADASPAPMPAPSATPLQLAATQHLLQGFKQPALALGLSLLA